MPLHGCHCVHYMAFLPGKAWGDDRAVFLLHCLEDALYVHGHNQLGWRLPREGWHRPGQYFLAGTSNGGNAVLNARQLPGSRGLLAFCPFDHEYSPPGPACQEKIVQACLEISTPVLY